jgi:hypothetical protein
LVLEEEAAAALLELALVLVMVMVVVGAGRRTGETRLLLEECRRKPKTRGT